MKYVITLVLLGLISYGIYYYLITPGLDTPPVTQVDDSPDTTISTFSTAEYSFSPDLTKEGFTLEQGRPDSLFKTGQSFLVPVNMTTGTNLSKDSRIHVQINDTADSTCDPKAQSISTDYEGLPSRQGANGLIFAGAGGDEGAAGNFYETTVYTVNHNNKCYSIVKFIHSTNIGAYPEGTVRAFDAAPIEAYYDQVIKTFKIK